MAAGTRRGAGLAGLAWRTSSMVMARVPVAHAHSVAAPVFVASARLPGSLSNVSVTASRRWMSSTPEDPSGRAADGAAPSGQTASEPYQPPVGTAPAMESIPIYDPVGAPASPPLGSLSACWGVLTLPVESVLRASGAAGAHLCRFA